jgi:predicted  nucleic acid-binding Zn-ribbon protein
MNIPQINNPNNTPQNNPVQPDQGQVRQAAQNTVQNQRNQGIRDTFNQSPLTQRLRRLTERRQALQEEMTALQQQNPVETQNDRMNTIMREINGIEREIRNMNPEQTNNTDRRQMEAMRQYTEQNQTIVRNENNLNTNVRNRLKLFG